MLTLDLLTIRVKRSDISDDSADYDMWCEAASAEYCRVTGKKNLDWVEKSIPLGNDQYMVQFSNMTEGFEVPLEPPCIVEIID
jgi:hypothetical protein